MKFNLKSTKQQNPRSQLKENSTKIKQKLKKSAKNSMKPQKLLIVKELY